MNADVEQAVERVNSGEAVTATPHPDCDALVKLVDLDDWHTIRQALRDQEARITALDGRLMAALEDRRKWYALASERRDRAEKAEALLREVVRDEESVDAFNDLLTRITAHLGAEQ